MRASLCGRAIRYHADQLSLSPKYIWRVSSESLSRSLSLRAPIELVNQAGRLPAPLIADVVRLAERHYPPSGLRSTLPAPLMASHKSSSSRAGRMRGRASVRQAVIAIKARIIEADALADAVFGADVLQPLDAHACDLQGDTAGSVACGSTQAPA